MKQLKDNITIAKQRRKKLEKGPIARRLVRDSIRKKIASKEGVNYKRIILQNKVEKGMDLDKVDYRIKNK